MSGSQVNMPQFNAPAQTQVGQTPIGQYIYGSYAGQQDIYNQQIAQNNAMTSGLFGLGGSLGAAGILAKFSDRRLKKNIELIGMHTAGIPLYEFDYLWGEHSVGVMADEVEKVRPEAVSTINWYKVVDYGQL